MKNSKGTTNSKCEPPTDQAQSNDVLPERLAGEGCYRAYVIYHSPPLPQLPFTAYNSRLQSSTSNLPT